MAWHMHVLASIMGWDGMGHNICSSSKSKRDRDRKQREAETRLKEYRKLKGESETQEDAGIKYRAQGRI